MSDWYYAKDNQQMGPKNESEVKASIATGEIPADTLVWKDGMDGWLPANQVPAFSFRPPPAPAKVQPTAPVATTPAPAVTTTTAAPAATVTTVTPATITTTPAATVTPTTFAASKPLSSGPDKPAVDVSAQVQNALNSLSAGVGTPGDPADVEKNKTFALLSYLPPFLFLVALFAAKDSPFAKYHANQGLILCLTFLAINIPMNIVFFILAMILGSITFVLSSLFSLALLVVAVTAIYLGITNVNKGLMKPLPYIGNLIVIIK